MAMSADPAPSLAEETFVDTASGNDDPPAPIKGLRRLMWWIIPPNASIFLLWGAVPGVLLPQQIATQFGADAKVATLALVSTIGAFGAMVAQPIAGQISDRTRTRFGRRAPWMVLGALAGALALLGLAAANTVAGMAIAWVCVQIAFNFAQGPLSAIMPDRIPLKRRGTVAALTGLGLMVGNIAGSILGALFFNNIAVGYIFFAVFALVVLVLFNVFNPDYPSTDLTPEPLNVREFLSTFWVNPIKYPDFFWAFTGRLLLFTGYFAVVGYQLYMLTDYFGVARPETIIPILGILQLGAVLISTLVSGPLSDKIGRRKPFVFVSSALVSLAFLIPWLWHDVTAWMIMIAIASFGFGVFQAVDTALVSEVLPSAKSFAKDLGVVNIAATLPQTLAPAFAGAIVLTFGYAGLFPAGIIIGLLGAAAVWFIKSVR